MKFLSRLVAALVLMGCPAAFAQTGLVLTAADRTKLKADLADCPSGPGTLEQVNKAREEKARDLFIAAGAAAADVQLVTVKANGTGAAQTVSNVMVRVPGTSANSVVVVGAHLDKVAAGTGAIDDWSGCVAVVNLFQKFRGAAPKNTLVFVCFAYEEDDLWGSRTYVETLNAGTAPWGDKLDDIKAMVNLECLGVSAPRIWKNGSSPYLETLALGVDAGTSHVGLTSRNLPPGVGADSVPFFNKGVLAITFDSLAPADFGLIHTAGDNLTSLTKGLVGDAGYAEFFDAFRFAHDFLTALDADPVICMKRPASLTKPRREHQLEYRSFHPRPAAAPEKDEHAKPAPTPTEAKAAVASANRKWAEAVRTWAGEKDPNSAAAKAAATALAELYTETATLFPPELGGEAVRGRDAIRDYFAGLVVVVKTAERTATDLELTATGVAYERGTFKAEFKGDRPRAAGKTSVAWRFERDKGGNVVARYHVDLWHPNAPPDNPKP